MQLKYKITISIIIISLAILSSVSYIYSKLSYASMIDYQKLNLIDHASETSKHIEMELLDNLSSALTMTTAPIVLNSLRKSNLEYEKFTNDEKKSHIDELNKKWMSTDNGSNDFIKKYLENSLALFLKKQQSVFPGVYGEIFITNMHGAMIATTGKLTTLAHAEKYWWKAAYAFGKGKIFIDDRGFDASVNGYVIGIVVPIKSDNEIIGILKVNINTMSTLNDAVKSFALRNHGELKIVRTKGLIVYEDSFAPLSTRINSVILDELNNREIGAGVIKDFSKEVLIAYAPIKIRFNANEITFGGKPKTSGSQKGNENEIWHTVVTFDKELALIETKKTNILIIYIGLFVTFLSAIIAYIVGRWISKPIDELHIAKQKVIEQEEMLIAQSRHAAMGEMISMIAHQWRQPISIISMEANNMIADIALESVDMKKFEAHAESIIDKSQELSKTINDFKNFFRPENSSQEITIEDVFNDVFSVIGKSLHANNIEFIKDFHSTKRISTFSRELMQAIINIVQNSKDAILENTSKDGLIKVGTYDKKDGVLIKIIDNGGGIKDNIIDNIFDPYFSTKNKKNGTGIGLYMSKTIIEKHLNGKIIAYNNDDGACFEIELPDTL